MYYFTYHIVSFQQTLHAINTGALICNWTSFLMNILHDLSSRMRKINEIMNDFQVMQKNVLPKQNKLSTYKAFTVYIYTCKYDIII